MVVTVFLKEKGSKESKPVDTSHEETGNSLNLTPRRLYSARHWLILVCLCRSRIRFGKIR